MSSRKPYVAPGSLKTPENSMSVAVQAMASSKAHHIHNALLCIRTKHLKQKGAVTRFREIGGLLRLVNVLKQRIDKLRDIGLSVLGNCTATEEKSRQLIMKSNGIKVLGNILKQTERDAILNRAVRSLANLAQDQNCCQVIHDDGRLEPDDPTKRNKKQLKEEQDLTIIERIVDLLEKTEDKECQQTYLRAIRLLADTKAHQDYVLACGALKAACKTLQSSDLNVLQAAIKTVSHLTQTVEKESVVWQLVNGQGHTALVTLSNHDDEALAQATIALLLHFTKQDLLRPTLGPAGAVALFLEKLKDGKRKPKENTAAENSEKKTSIEPDSKDKLLKNLLKSDSSAQNCPTQAAPVDCVDDELKKILENPQRKIPFINAICLCCKEVVNRTRIRDGGGLQLLLKYLDCGAYRVLHNRLISTLVCFLYDDIGMEIMRTNGLVMLMLKHLRRVVRLRPDVMKARIAKLVDGKRNSENDHEAEPLAKRAKIEASNQADTPVKEWPASRSVTPKVKFYIGGDDDDSSSEDSAEDEEDEEDTTGDQSMETVPSLGAISSSLEEATAIEEGTESSVESLHIKIRHSLLFDNASDTVFSSCASDENRVSSRYSSGSSSKTSLSRSNTVDRLLCDQAKPVASISKENMSNSPPTCSEKSNRALPLSKSEDERLTEVIKGSSLKYLFPACSTKGSSISNVDSHPVFTAGRSSPKVACISRNLFSGTIADNNMSPKTKQSQDASLSLFSDTESSKQEKTVDRLVTFKKEDKDCFSSLSESSNMLRFDTQDNSFYASSQENFNALDVGNRKAVKVLYNEDAACETEFTALHNQTSNNCNQKCMDWNSQVPISELSIINDCPQPQSITTVESSNLYKPVVVTNCATPSLSITSTDHSLHLSMTTTGPSAHQSVTATDDSHSGLPIKPTLKYSIDSPTYQAISQYQLNVDTVETDGPKNILDACNYNFASQSTPSRSPPSSPKAGSYSPLSVSSYLARNFSPESSPRSQSPYSDPSSPPPPDELGYSPVGSNCDSLFSGISPLAGSATISPPAFRSPAISPKRSSARNTSDISPPSSPADPSPNSSSDALLSPSSASSPPSSPHHQEMDAALHNIFQSVHPPPSPALRRMTIVPTDSCLSPANSCTNEVKKFFVDNPEESNSQLLSPLSSSPISPRCTPPGVMDVYTHAGQIDSVPTTPCGKRHSPPSRGMSPLAKRLHTLGRGISSPPRQISPLAREASTTAATTASASRNGSTPATTSSGRDSNGGGVLWWCPDQDAEAKYSSTDSDDALENMECTESETGAASVFLSKDADDNDSVLLCEEALNADPVYNHVMASTDFGVALKGNSLAVTLPSSSPDTSTDSMRSFQRKARLRPSSSTPRKPGGSPGQAGSPRVGTGSPRVGTGSPRVGTGSPRVGTGSPRVGTGSPRVGTGSPRVGTGSSRAGITAEARSRIQRQLSTSSNRSSSLDIGSLMTRLRAQSQKSEGKLDGLDIDKYKDPRKATEHNILVLLSKLSYVDDPSTDIVTEDVIVSLLRYIKHAHEPIPRASRILLRVSRNPLCLEKMVGGVRLPWLVEEALDNDLLTLNNIEDDADKMSDGKRKREDGSSSFKMTNETSGLQHQLHSNLALLADSRFGQHVLLRLLQTGSEEARINCALSLPYLCSSDFVRVRLLQEAGGLHLLCVCLLNYPLPAFHGIVTLANFLNVDMKLSETSFSQLAEEHPVLSGQNDLTFILDNQQTVMAERSVMAASSQVFAAMLEGHFSESKQQTVAIAKTEKLPFELVVSYLHGNDLWLQKLRKQDESKTNGGSSNSISLDIALEVLELSERFIVAGLQLKLQMIIYQHLLTKDNVKVIIEFALQHNMNEMTCQCIRYILGNCELEYEDRVNVGKTLMEEHEASEFVSAVEQVLGEQLEER